MEGASKGVWATTVGNDPLSVRMLRMRDSIEMIDLHLIFMRDV